MKKAALISLSAIVAYGQSVEQYTFADYNQGLSTENARVLCPDINGEAARCCAIPLTDEGTPFVPCRPEFLALGEGGCIAGDASCCGPFGTFRTFFGCAEGTVCQYNGEATALVEDRTREQYECVDAPRQCATVDDAGIPQEHECCLLIANRLTCTGAADLVGNCCADPTSRCCDQAGAAGSGNECCPDVASCCDVNKDSTQFVCCEEGHTCGDDEADATKQKCHPPVVNPVQPVQSINIWWIIMILRYLGYW